MKLAEHRRSPDLPEGRFLAAARGVSVGIHFQRKIMTGLFGGEGFIMQKLEGDGWVFVHAGGTVVERELAPGEAAGRRHRLPRRVPRRASISTCQRRWRSRSMLFGGEGVFFATLTGPGKVWLQSLPFSRMAGRMLAAGGPMGRSVDEGSVLGPLGGILDGDNR